MADLAQLARDMREIARALPQIERASRREVTRQTKALAYELSSGVFLQETFDTPVSEGGLGAPYGHGSEGWLGPRGPIPYGDPAVINVQSGLFRSAWRVIETGSMTLLYNAAPYAEYLEHGTKLMIRRPMDVYLNRYVAIEGPKVFMQVFEKFARRALNK